MQHFEAMQLSPRAAHGLSKTPIGGGGEGGEGGGGEGGPGGGQGGAGGDGSLGLAGGGTGGGGGLGGVHSAGQIHVGEVKHGCGSGLHSACACAWPHCLKQPKPSEQHLWDQGASMQDL